MENTPYFATDNGMSDFPAASYPTANYTMPPTAPQQMAQPMMSEIQPPGTYVSVDSTAYIPETLSNTAFLPAYLSQNIGKWMKLELLIGNALESRIGQLIKVGASYVVIKMNTTPISSMVCDMYSIKFVTIIYSNEIGNLHP